MHPLMNRLTELLGPSVARQLATEFGGQTIYLPLRPAIGQRDAEILAEFDGNNHEALARKYHISLQWVYRLVAQSRREAVADVLQAALGSSPQVLWAAHLTQLAILPGIEAVLRAAEKARAQGCQDRLVIALAILPEVPATGGPASVPPAPVVPAENQSATPAPAGNPLPPSVVQPSSAN